MLLLRLPSTISYISYVIIIMILASSQPLHTSTNIDNNHQPALSQPPHPTNPTISSPTTSNQHALSQSLQTMEHASSQSLRTSTISDDLQLLRQRERDTWEREALIRCNLRDDVTLVDKMRMLRLHDWIEKMNNPTSIMNAPTTSKQPALSQHPYTTNQPASSQPQHTTNKPVSS